MSFRSAAARAMTIAMEGDEDKGGEPAAGLPQDRLPEPSGAPFRLLDGVRVLDLTTSIAGPTRPRC